MWSRGSSLASCTVPISFPKLVKRFSSGQFLLQLSMPVLKTVISSAQKLLLGHSPDLYVSWLRWENFCWPLRNLTNSIPSTAIAPEISSVLWHIFSLKFNLWYHSGLSPSHMYCWVFQWEIGRVDKSFFTRRLCHFRHVLLFTLKVSTWSQ